MPASYSANDAMWPRVSGLDQPLLLATVNYHVGHTMSIRVAEEHGFFREEGLGDYIFDDRGMLPGPFEHDALALMMEEHGVDIALGAGIAAALHQRAAGAEHLHRRGLAPRRAGGYPLVRGSSI